MRAEIIHVTDHAAMRWEQRILKEGTTNVKDIVSAIKESKIVKKNEKNDNILPIYSDGDTIFIKFSTETSLKEQINKVKQRINLIKNNINISKEKLSNSSFINKAPKDIVEKEKNILKSLVNDLNQLESIISIKN